MIRRSLLLLCAAFLLCASTTVFAQITFTDSGFANEKVVAGFSTPIGFVFAPDGRMFIWERYGKVKIFKNGALLSTPFVDLAGEVNTSGDRGLIGLALDPDFETNGYVYLSYVVETAGNPTSTDPRPERVTRVQADPNNKDRALAGSETVLLGKKTALPCNAGEDCFSDEINAHTIDHLLFGPDGKLYASAGDGGDWRSATQTSLRAQSLDSLNGKVLRVNKDGSAPGDNPFYDGTNSVKSKVYAYGVRNPFRFWFGPNNQLMIGDVGWTTYEEIDFGRGHNFGWPCYEGGFPQPSFQSAYTLCKNLPASSVTMPSYFYQHVANVGGCIIMGPYLQNSPYAAKYNNQVYFADFSNKWLKRASMDSSGTVTGVTTFATALKDPVYIAQGPDGNLYWLSVSAGTVYRIRYTGSANRAPTAVASANPTAGPSPLTVSFSSAGTSDPDGDALTYSWDFGDGTTSTAANPSHQYVTSTITHYTVTLTVKDPSGATNSDSLTVTAGDNPPTANILAPADGVTVQPEATVNFNGNGTDPEDGTLPGTSLLWTQILHHNTHTHLIKQVTGTSGSFVADLPDTVDTYWYELQLQATDSAGVTNTKSVRINIAYTQTGTPCLMNSTDPSVTICSPASGATVTSPVHVIAGTTDSAGITAMKIYLDNVGVYTTSAGNLDTSITAGAGSHTIVVQAWDKAGRIVNSSRTFTVSSSTGGGGGGTCAAGSVDPSITVCSPVSGSTVSSPVHFNVSTTNSAGVTGMKIYVDSTSAFSTTANSISTDLAMAAGTHSIVVKSWDKLGRITSKSLSVTVSGASGGGGGSGCTAKTTDPSITVCSPLTGSTVSSPVAFNVLTTNSAGVTGMKIYVDSVGVYTTTAGTINTSLAMAAGTHNVVVKSWDKLGRVTAQSLTVTVTGSTSGTCTAKTTDPSITVCSPLNGATVASPVHFKVLTTNASGVTGMKIYVDSVGVYTATTGSIDTSLALAAGKHSIVVKSWDRAGRVIAESLSITVSP